MIIVVARYFPGARTAVSTTAGAVGYEWRRFAGFGVVAAVTWATYSALVGVLGGVAFERNVFMGLLLGLALAAALAAVAEIARHALHRRQPSPASAGHGVYAASNC